MSNKITGAEILVRALIDQGVDTMFGYPGGSIIPVYDRLFDYTDRLTHILVRHEQGAIHAAQGYARATGKTGVVISTSGPGAMNLLTGLSDAQIDSTPVVAITGQVGSLFLGKDAFQESDVISTVLPITKWACQVRKAEEISAAVAKAFYIAGTGRPGPVLLDISKDAQTSLAEYEFVRCKHIRSYDPEPDINTGRIARVAGLINKAERPMVLAGQGVTIAGAQSLLQELVEKADIPVGCTMLGLSTLPSDHRLNMGMLGIHGNIAPNVCTNKADLIVAVGMRFDDRVTGDVAKYAPQATIVHIDIDASEFDKTIKSHIHIHGSAEKALAMLLPLVEEKKHTEWVESFAPHAQVERERVIEREVNASTPDGRMLMGEVVSKVSRAMGDDAILVTDVGQNQMFAVRYFRFKSPRSLISSGGLGTMGFGIPAAIGAKIGRPDRQVVLFVGDGGFQMTIQELGTIMEYGVAVKIVLLNNNFLGNVRQWQHLFFNSRYSATPMLNPDFSRLVSSYGIKAIDVPHRDMLDSAITDMVATDGPVVLNVNIDETDMVFPLTPVGYGVDEIMLNATEFYQC